MKLILKSQRRTKYNIAIKKNLDKIAKLYEDGQSISSISRDLLIDRQALTRLFKDNQIEIRGKHSYARKYDLNEYYFDVIDNEEKAYMLGFIYADGNNLFQTNRVQIELSKIDEGILQKFSQNLYGSQILKYRSRTNKNGKLFEYISLNLFSQHMSKQLAKLGVVERKSKKIEFPEWLGKSLQRHFIRGLIDGDGWIYLPNTNRASPFVGLICTRKMNDSLLELFSDELGIEGYLCKAHKQDVDVMCELRVKNYHRCKILLDWLYKGSTIYLDRKYKRYNDFLNVHKGLRQQNK